MSKGRSMRRSTSYIDTIDTSNPDFESLVNVVRRTIKTVNMRNRETARWTKTKPVQYFVRVRGRLGKDNPNAHLYRRGGPLYRYTSQDIRVEHSERVDVYISIRHSY